MSVSKKTTPNKGIKNNKAQKAASTKGGQPVFLFDKKNYYLMFAGLALIIIGFLLMTGAKVTDPDVFDYSEIYSFRRVTLAPILIVGGFVVEVFAIMRKPKENNTTTS